MKLLRLARGKSTSCSCRCTTSSVMVGPWVCSLVNWQRSMRLMRLGQSRRLAELEIQYGDYAVWQREWLRGEVLDQQLAYWRKQLAGVPPVLELPTDYPRPAVRTFNGAAMSLNLSASLSEELKALSRRERCDAVHEFAGGVSSPAVALQRGRRTLRSGRRWRIGRERRRKVDRFFVNTLVLRTDVSGNPAFRGVAAAGEGSGAGGYAHQDVPFEKLVEELAAGAEPECHSALSGGVCNGKYSVT